MIDNNWDPTSKRKTQSSLASSRASNQPGKSDDAHASSMVEKERQRLEAMKRRQEKEMQVMTPALAHSPLPKLTPFDLLTANGPA